MSRSWLQNLGLEQYEAAFRENDVDAEVLPTLTADELKDIGVSSIRPPPASTGGDRRITSRGHAG